MNRRERILAAINRQTLDRIPTDIWATHEVWEKLQQYFGPDVDIRSELGIDGFHGVGPEYIGPPLPKPPENEHYGGFGYWGIRDRIMYYETGAYSEQSFWPLAHARTIADLEQFNWPSADWFDYKPMREQAQLGHENAAVQSGYMAPFFLHNLLRGLEQSLMDPHDDAEFTHYLLKRISDFFYEMHLRIFETCESLIDVAQVTDDYGSQFGPMISLTTFRKFYKPHLKRFIDLCHGFGIKVFHHDDGAIREFLPDLVEMGIDILNPVQHICPGMEMEGLKHDFGDKLCFHGAIDNQQVLPFGTPEDVRAEVRRAIDALASDQTGYILAPCHNLQAVTPVENIIAMYDEAAKYGRF